MIFLHGQGGSDAVRHAYEVATSADRYGFVGVVPTGSPMMANERFEWNIVSLEVRMRLHTSMPSCARSVPRGRRSQGRRRS